jgi:NTP pyrophosphatase (non-canonical NTP hydrolase)
VSKPIFNYGATSGRFDSSKPNQANTPKGGEAEIDAWGSRLYARTLNDLSKICRDRADKWYHDLETGERVQLNKGERFMLMVTELAEAFEGERKNLMDSHLPHRRAVEVEMADELIRMFDYAGEQGLDLGGAFVEKLEYNRTREDHTDAARRGEHGKKF